MSRCFGDGDPLYERYHDEEWGRPVTDERGLLSKHVQQTRIERVQNVNTNQTFVSRVLRVGTVDFDTAGTDDSDFTFIGVGSPHDVVDAVDRAQREATAAGHARPDGL